MERRNPFRVAHQIRLASRFPGLPKSQPWAEFANTFGVAHQIRLASRFPGLPKLNPGLKFANTFGVALPNVCGFSPEVPKPPP